MKALPPNLIYLRKQRNFTQEELGEVFNVGRTTVTSWEKGVSNPDIVMLYKMAEYFNVSLGDLLDKDLSKAQDVNEPEAIYSKKGDAVLLDMSDKQVMWVPLVNQYAYGGYLRGYADESFIEKLPKTTWQVDRQYKGRYISIEVRGDSMDDDSRDSIVEGDVLLCREIKPDLWATSKLHIRKWDFVIVHKTEGILVKRITDHNVEQGTIKIHSLNDLYPDEEIRLKDIAQILNVVQIARKR